MNTLLDNEDNEDRGHPRDREITLGTTTVLGIFFAIAILCAGFFGFGYSLGSKRSATTVAAVDPTTGKAFSSFKPAPGSPLVAAGRSDGANPYAPPPSPATVTATNGKSSIPAPGEKAPAAAFEPDTEPSAPAKPVKTVGPPPVTAPLPAVAAPLPGAAQSVVQIAALTRQEDAEMISSELKRKGYNVLIRQESQDKLFHVQVGPFATKKDSETMRQRLLADGFNAYLK